VLLDPHEDATSSGSGAQALGDRETFFAQTPAMNPNARQAAEHGGRPLFVAREFDETAPPPRARCCSATSRSRSVGACRLDAGELPSDLA